MKTKVNLLVIISAIVLFTGCRLNEPEGLVESSAGSMLIDPALEWSSRLAEVTLGRLNVFPVLANEYGVDVSYSSSDVTVAEISENGEITLLAGGVTTIEAYSEKSAGYISSSASYRLVVLKSETGLSWSVASCTAIIGNDDNVFPVLENPNDLKVTYTSSNTDIARISGEGVVELVGEGTVVITVSSQETDGFEAENCSYQLVVKKKENFKSDAGIGWSADEFSMTYGETAVFPSLSNPNNLSVTYSCVDESVAKVSADGMVTALSAGVTTIIASTSADDSYYACSVFYKLIINRAEVSLTWSESTCGLALGEDKEYPTLVADPSGLDIVYSSSDPTVAAVYDDGTISVIGVGTTVISAIFAGDERYMPAEASCTLAVYDGTDVGAGTYTYPSTGDSASEDDIVNTTFTRKITIIYSQSADAKVIGDYYGYVTIDGNDAVVNDTGSEYIVYELQGTTKDGFLKLYSNNRQALLLNGVDITNPSGAAVNIQSRKRTFVMVEGVNAFADGSSYVNTPDTEDEKAAFFSEGQLIFSGSGTMTVNAEGKAGITSDDYIRVMNSPVIRSSSSSGHAIRGQEAIQIDGGTITASTSAAMKKGFSSDDRVEFNGGTTTITVTGGTAYDSEAADYTSSAGVKADKLFYMNGGSLTITNSGSGGKGISVGSSDAANDCKAYFTGGIIDITCSGAYDTAAESGAKGIKVGKKFSDSSLTGDMYVSGGVIAVRSIGANTSRDSGNEAVESKGVLEVSGGELFAYSTSDDAINSAEDFNITGGYVCGISTGNDGLDSNGNFYIKGGVVMAASSRSPEVGIDANTEGGKKLYVQGGVLFVTGGLESGASLTQSCYKVSSFTKGIWYGLTVGSQTYAFKTHSSAGGSSLIVSGSSAPTLNSNISVSGGNTYFDGYANRDGEYSGGTKISLSSYSGSSGGNNRP